MFPSQKDKKGILNLLRTAAAVAVTVTVATIIDYNW